MQRFILLTCLTAFVMTSQAFAQQMEDVVYLKDGSIIRGTIIEKISGESLKIRTRGGNVFVFTMDEIAKVSKEPVKRNPWIASGLSLLVPGAGQAYNRQFGDGLGYLLRATIGIVGVYVTVEDDYKNRLGHTVDPDSDNWMGGLAVGLWFFSHLGSVLEPFPSNETNRQSQQPSYGHLIELGGSRATLGADPVVSHNNLGTRLTLHF